MGIFVSIVAVSFMVFFHELGHFLVARFFGIKVFSFSIGFGPKILSFSKGGTTYQLSLLPLGGYVKMKGGAPLHKRKYRSFAQKDEIDKTNINDRHPLVRIAIIFAGPLFNFILAFIIFLFVLMFSGIDVANNELLIGNVGKEYKAASLLQSGDRILSINEVKIQGFSEIRGLLQGINGDSVKLEIQRGGDTLSLNVPLSIKDGAKLLGISPQVTRMTPSFFESINIAFNQMIDSILIIYDGLKKLIVGAIGIENLSGIIGITDISSQAYNSNFMFFMFIIALVSVNLGIINLLPLPALDGGQILFCIYEWVFRRRVNRRIADILSFIGISFLVAMMILGAFNDISRIINRI